MAYTTGTGYKLYLSAATVTCICAPSRNTNLTGRYGDD